MREDRALFTGFVHRCGLESVMDCLYNYYCAETDVK